MIDEVKAIIIMLREQTVNTERRDLFKECVKFDGYGIYLTGWWGYRMVEQQKSRY